MYYVSPRKNLGGKIIDLDFDSTRMQLDALGHTLMPFWSVLSCHLCYSQVIPTLNKSLLTVQLQFVRGRLGPLLNPGTSQCNACRCMRWWSIRITCPSQWSLLSPRLGQQFFFLRVRCPSVLCRPTVLTASGHRTLKHQTCRTRPNIKSSQYLILTKLSGFS